MKLLFAGAHPDDIETGAAGFLTKMKEQGNECIVAVFSNCEEQEGNEGITEEFKKSMETLGVDKFMLLDFPNTKMPENASEIRTKLEKIRDEHNPDIIVTHDLNTTHQDHKTLTEACIRVFRERSIFMYEELKSTPKFVANLIVPITPEQLEKKIKSLECYKTQFRRYYFDMDYVRSLARVRGKVVNQDHAEAFNIYQHVW